MAERHVNWFALEKACAQPGCPVCAIVADRSRRYIDNMLFEHVSDRGFRAQYRESGGFCPDHAKSLDAYRDGLAVAILGVDVLKDALPALFAADAAEIRLGRPVLAQLDGDPVGLRTTMSVRVRAGALTVLASDYVLAARSCGIGKAAIARTHVLPNIAPLIGVQASVSFAMAILAEAALSYLGLGTQPPKPSWGSMLKDAQQAWFADPLQAVWPGLAIALAVLGFNLLGDGLRDLLDPRLREEVG